MPASPSIRAALEQLSELHPLEEGKHAAQSGMDLKAYAEASGKARQSLQYKLYSYRVLASVPHMRHEDIRDNWRNLAEIHAAPHWLWKALVAEMLDTPRARGRGSR